MFSAINCASGLILPSLSLAETFPSILSTVSIEILFSTSEYKLGKTITSPSPVLSSILIKAIFVPDLVIIVLVSSTMPPIVAFWPSVLG